MKIEKPKEWSILINEVIEKYSPDEFFEQMDRFKPIDEKGRYLHWDELRRRSDQCNEPKATWVSIKSARRKISKNIPLKDIEGNHFRFAFRIRCNAYCTRSIRWPEGILAQ